MGATFRARASRAESGIPRGIAVGLALPEFWPLAGHIDGDGTCPPAFKISFRCGGGDGVEMD
jgi:hypothetical protein